MKNKRIDMNNQDQAFKELEKIVDKYSIEVIKNYIKTYDKKSRKLRKKGNKRDDVAIEVYNLVIDDEYDITNAIYQVSINRDASEKTIKNHKDTFYREAKEVYLEVYKEHYKKNTRKDFEPIYYYMDEFYEGGYRTRFEHFEELSQNHLKTYHYLFWKVFPTKKDIQNKMEEIEKNTPKKTPPSSPEIDISKDGIPF